MLQLSSYVSLSRGNCSAVGRRRKQALEIGEECSLPRLITVPRFVEAQQCVDGGMGAASQKRVEIEAARARRVGVEAGQVVTGCGVPEDTLWGASRTWREYRGLNGCPQCRLSA